MSRAYLELILGGARSGKSDLACRRAGADRLYLATGVAGDAEMARRIAHHRARRDASWRLVEEPVDLAGALRTHCRPGRTVVVDCLTLWLANCLERDCWEAAREALFAALPDLAGHLIFVANEVGSGVVPLGALSRRFVDEAGRLHQQLAERCARVILVVAGLPLTLKEERPPPAEAPPPIPDGGGEASLEEILEILAAPLPRPDEAARGQALARQRALTKPPGSLGRVEALATAFAAWQGTSLPALERVAIRIYAADHGVARRGVSAYPPQVTAQMVGNFARGGAAIAVLARALAADFAVVDLGTIEPPPLEGARHPVLRWAVGPGTADFCAGPAMERPALARALAAGRATAPPAGTHLFVGGEMGIGNTTAAAALTAALLDLPPEAVVGPGTGVEGARLAAKRAAVAEALARHRGHLAEPGELLRRLGGFEIAALAAAYLTAAARRVPVLVDGYIATAAAAWACRLNPGLRPWLLFAHRSAEPGHGHLLAALDAEPLLDLGLRLGEGSGAALAVPLLALACRLHREMATFQEAGVADG